MANPFLAVKRRKLAEKAKAAANAQRKKKEEKRQAELPNAQKEFELLLNSVRRDAERVSKLPRGSQRVELKKELLTEYLPAIEKYLEGEAYRNEVFAWVIVWLWDVCNIDLALKYTRIAIEQGQIMPERFKSTVAEFAARKMRDFAEQEQFSTDKEIAAFALFIENTGEWSLPEPLIAELYAALGKVYFAEKDYKKAEIALDKSFELGGKVKTLRDKCKKELAPKVEKPKAKVKKPAAKKKSKAKK